MYKDLTIYLNHLRAQTNELSTRIQQTQELVEKLQKTVDYLKAVKTNIIKETIEISTSIVNSLIQILGPEYSFTATIEEDKLKFKILKNGIEFDPKYELGGGVLDLISLGLRLSLWAISSRTPLLVLDEPLRYLSREYKPAVANFLSQLCQTLNLRILIITHDPELIIESENVIVYSTRNHEN